MKALPGQGTRTAQPAAAPASPFTAAFLDNAASIFEVAEQASHGPAGEADSPDWSILVGPKGAIHMVAGSDWSLDSLQAHHGAPMAYRVRRHAGTVRLEGRAGSRTCLFEATKPDGAAHLLLANAPLYRVVGPTPSPLPACTSLLLPAASD